MLCTYVQLVGIGLYGGELQKMLLHQ
jgi:hypothetical protein